ncbi:hypothetical protein JZ751_028569 [Albula glossodonta]|uniref:ALMS motif domain-containing protein n=1 Tax=Albula glossodonta TaxID=121402 RepID=A0A8T2NIR0_9TELE|nr:hypothetical protein JZ751_028569 [Albula glossodonta]
MKRKVAKMGRLRLSPNEEAQLIKEEHERRRKLRLQQVREQERYIALQIRKEVQNRRHRELQNLEEELREEWQRQQKERLQTLEKQYQDCLRAVGEGHRSAKENEPDLEALVQKAEEQHERAAERHREALRELKSRRQRQQEEQTRHIQARRKALLVEKERAAKVASLPPPPPEPFEKIDAKRLPPVKMTDVDNFSVSHFIMPETAVEREEDTDQQPDARRAAEEEALRLAELGEEEERERREQLAKARLRGNHALRKEHLNQDRERLLQELARMQQADLLRRRRAVAQMPPQSFQSFYGKREIREDRQRELEFAFEDMYSGERRMKGDLVLQLVPEPLPAVSADAHDDDLDVTLEPEVTPAAEQDAVDRRSPFPPAQMRDEPAEGAPPHALRKLLNKIRTQKSQWCRHADGEKAADSMTIESGSIASEDRVGRPPPVPTNLDHLQLSEGQETTEETIVAGTLLPTEEQVLKITAAEAERRKREEELEQQKREQIELLERLEEQRRTLELHLQQAQREKEILQTAVEVNPGRSVQQEVPEREQEAPGSSSFAVCPEMSTEPLSSAVEGTEEHLTKVRQYQQRLLDQSRQHKQSLEEARRRLAEYQHTLKMRYPRALLTTGLNPAGFQNVPPLQAGLPLAPATGLLHGPCVSTDPSSAARLSPPSTLAPKQGLAEAIRPSGSVSVPCPPLHPQSGDIHIATETPSSAPTREPSRAPPAAPLPFTVSDERRNLLLIEPAGECQAETPQEDSHPPSRVSPPVAPVYQDPKAPSLEPVLAEPHGQPDRASPTSPDPSPGLGAGPMPCAAEMEAQRQELQEAQQRVEAQRKAFLDQQRAQEERLLLQQDQLREQMRRQREALDAFLSEAQADASPQPDSAEALEVSRAERLSLVSTLLRAIEESNGSLAPPQSTEPPSHSLQNQADVLGHMSLSSDLVSQADPPSKVPAPTRAPKPPLARPRLGILEILEQHELSAIQEVETPVDASLVTVGDDSVEASSTWPEAAEEPGGPSRVDRAESRASRGSRGGQSSESDPGSGSGVRTGRSSRLSWRDRLQLDMESSSEQDAVRAAGSLPHLSSDNTQDVLTFPGPPITSVTADEEGRVSPFCSESRYTDQTPECLSSFTISTGSFSTNEPDLSSAAINASTLSAEATGRGGVSTPTLRRSSSSSSSSNGGVSARLSPASESVLDSSNIQRIIDKYTRELNVSLASVGKRSGGPCSAETSPATPRVISDSGESSSSPSLSRATVEGPSLAFGHDISSVHSYQETTQTFHGSLSGLYLQDPHGGLGGRGFMETLEDLSKSSFDGTQNSSCRFLPLEPRPDFDSSTSTSSSSRRSERRIQIRGAEEWDVAGRRTGQHSGQSTPQHHTEGRDSTMSRLIGHLPDQTTSHWLKERSDFTTRRAIGPSSDDPTEQLLGEVTSEWGEVSSGQSSQRLGEAQSSSGVEYGGPAHPFQFPNTAPVPGCFLFHPSTSLPMCDTQEAMPTFTQLLSQRTGQDMFLDSSKLQDMGTFQQTSAVHSQELEDPSDGDRTLVDPSSDSFHPLLAEVTQNEAAELSVTFHPPVQDPDSPCGSDVTLHAELPSPDLSGGVTDPNSTLEPPPSPEHLRAEAQDLSLCPLPSPLGSLCQLAESLCGSQISVSMESLSREDGHLAGHHLSTLAIPEVPSLALPPERACADEGAEAVALASGKRAAKATDGKAGSGSTPSQPVWERLLEVGSGEGILEEPELSLMELTKSTMQELSLAEEEEEEKEAQSEAREAFGEQLCKAVSLSEDGGGSKLESVPSHAVMQLEFQWRAGDLQQALLQKRQDFIQRSARRLEELRTRQEEKRKSPHVSRPKVAPQSQRSLSRSQPQPQGGGELKKVGEVRVCAPEHRKMEEAQMYQRTERLYNQLEEVKQRKEMRLRQESYAKNREKAKEFQKKTLQKLRAKQAQR